MLVQQVAEYMRRESAKVLVGQDEAWMQLVVALLSGGHVLLEGVHQGLQASYLNQPVQIAALRPRLQQLTGHPGWAQVLLRIGVPTKALPAAPRRPVSDVIIAE